jgi:uncharacterized protein (TIGR02118 family)
VYSPRQTPNHLALPRIPLATIAPMHDDRRRSSVGPLNFGVTHRNRLHRPRSMIKLVYCITKKPGMPDDEFFHYWEHVHGPIGALIPGVRRLVQSHRADVPGDSRAADYDGMVELWFDDIEALLAARRSPEWRASSEDEVNFIDHTRVAYFVSVEHPLI